MGDILEPDELHAIEAELMADGEGFGENSEASNQQKEQNKYKRVLNAKALAKALDKIATVAARMSGNKALILLPEEVQELGEALEPVAVKYLPDMLDKHGAEFAAGLAVGGIGMRMWADSSTESESKNG